MASVDLVIVDFANFCRLLHTRLGWVDQGCNFELMSKKLVNYLKENSSLEDRKNVFIGHCFDNRYIIQPLFFLYANKNVCFELINASTS